MRVAFLVQALQLYGGVGIVVGHARRLRERHGIDAQIVVTKLEREADWSHAGLGGLPIHTLDEVRGGEPFDVAVATWWETTLALHAVPAHRRAYFVQSMEDRFYGPDEPEREAAALTHDLPVAMITEARWIAEQLRALRPGLPVHYVRNGIDKSIFAIGDQPTPRLTGPLRIVVEGSPDVWLKGVPEALRAAAAMNEPKHLTLVTADRGDATAAADETVGPLTAQQMAALYARSDVVLKLSRVEGMFAPPLEGFHCGATCVVSPVTGHDEYVVDGHNGLVTSWDDERGTTSLLDLLARDRSLLHELKVNALATARAWPSTEQSSAFMALALARIAAAPDPDPTGAAERMVAEARQALNAQRARRREHERLRVRMGRVERLMEIGPLKAVRRWRGGG